MGSLFYIRQVCQSELSELGFLLQNIKDVNARKYQESARTGKIIYSDGFVEFHNALKMMRVATKR